jgi:hypothetical protein
VKALLQVATLGMLAGLCCACSHASNGGGTTTGQGGESELSSGGAADHVSVGGSGSGGSRPGSSGSAGVSSTTPGFCPKVDTECGGDLVGSWTYVSTCGPYPTSEEDADPDMPCEGEMVTLIPQDQTTFTFRADGTYFATGGKVVKETFHVPKACLDGQPCPPSDASFMVIDVGDACDVTTIEMNDVSTDAGTYRVTGNTLTRDNDEPSGFCVSGETLYIGAKDASLLGHMTLSKQ